MLCGARVGAYVVWGPGRGIRCVGVLVGALVGAYVVWGCW